jgi:hypothetical protein
LSGATLPHVDGQQDARPALGQGAARAPAQQPRESLPVSGIETHEVFGAFGHGAAPFQTIRVATIPHRWLYGTFALMVY